MERETGIEPATSSLGSWRSTAELLPLKKNQQQDNKNAGKRESREHLNESRFLQVAEVHVPSDITGMAFSNR